MIDWTLIVNRLRSSQGSMVTVGKGVSADPVALGKLARGEVIEPKFSVGIRLLDMHLDDYPQEHGRINL